MCGYAPFVKSVITVSPWLGKKLAMLPTALPSNITASEAMSPTETRYANLTHAKMLPRVTCGASPSIAMAWMNCRSPKWLRSRSVSLGPKGRPRAVVAVAAALAKIALQHVGCRVGSWVVTPMQVGDTVSFRLLRGNGGVGVHLPARWVAGGASPPPAGPRAARQCTGPR